MIIEYDPVKNTRNVQERQLSFDDVRLLDWDTALIREDVRKAYPEHRYVALALLGERLHVLCFTPTENGIRVISFRKANKRERRNYESH